MTHVVRDVEIVVLLADGAVPLVSPWWVGLLSMIVGLVPVAIFAAVVIGVRRLLGLE